MTKEEMLRLLTAAYTGPGSAAEGTFAGDVLRAWRHWPQRPPPATPTTTPRGADRWRTSCG